MASVLQEYQIRLEARTDIQQHLPFMHETVLGYERPVAIELGIQAGNSTSALLSAVEQRGGVLYSCDIQSREELGVDSSGGHRRVPDEWWDNPNWRVFHGDDLSADALSWGPPQCDVLFVDTDHSYEHVLGELRSYMPWVKPGGTALFHDTQYLYRDGQDVDLGSPDGPVAHAINLYCKEAGLSWDNRPGSYGMGVIRL